MTATMVRRPIPIVVDRGRLARDLRDTVVLWPDTFTTAFAPFIGASAIGVLEAAGYDVIVPQGWMCCGLTWISTGQLDAARAILTRTVDRLAPYLRAGLPVVGLEPSCTGVFRSDAADLLGDNHDVQRLRDQTRTLAELLTDHTGDLDLHGLDRHAIVQRHCHQYAVLGFDADTKMMNAAGLDVEVLDSGCCGLAGNFGMTPQHRDVSLACAEQAMLPAVRAADPETVVIADGFSCRTQIDDARTGRRAAHLAEVLSAAVRGTPLGVYPERAITHRPGDARRGRQDATA